MALKLSILLAMFLGLLSYSQSTSGAGGVGPPLSNFEKLFAKAGYVKKAESDQGRGLTVVVFEMNAPTRPHYHRAVQMRVTARDEHVIGVSHDESNPELPD